MVHGTRCHTKFLNGKLYIDCSTWQPFAKTNQDILERIHGLIKEQDIKGVILDLRNNDGANTQAIQSLVEYLKTFNLNENNIALLGGAGTYSNGVIAFATLRENFNGKFIGESLGQPADVYGEAPPRIYDLETQSVADISQLIRQQVEHGKKPTRNREGFRYSASTKLFDKSNAVSKSTRTSPHFNPRSEIKPDIEIKQTLKDYVSGYDRQKAVATDYIDGILKNQSLRESGR